MNKTYKFKKAYLYSKETKEYQITLDDSFEFSECCSPGFEVIGYKHYLCVIEGGSKYKDLLEGLEDCSEFHIYQLPHDIVILSVSNIEFLEGSPNLISLQELNEKLKTVMEETVWEELQAGSLDTLSVYKLSWIGGEDNVTLCCIDNKGLYESQELLRKPITFWEKGLDSIEEDVYTLSDHKIIKTLVGEEAKVLWNSLLGKALKEIGYNPVYDQNIK